MKQLSITLFFILFFACHLHAFCGDTIQYVDSHPHIVFSITATLDKQFTVRYPDGEIEQTFTGTGEPQSIFIQLPYGNYDKKEIIIEGGEGCAFTLFLAIMHSVSSVDVSKSPSIKRLIGGSGLYLKEKLENINLSNCVNLEDLHIRGGRLTNLDLSDCSALKSIACCNHDLSVLDINLSNNPAIETIRCVDNHLPLSNLYALSELSDEEWPDFGLGRQTLGSRRVLPDDTLDYSSQKEFGGISTNFYVMRGTVTSGYHFEDAPPLAPSSDYTLDNGIITFHRAGRYTVDMRNTAIKQHYWYWLENPARALVWVNVIDFVPVMEITNIPVSTTVGTEVRLSGRTVLPNNATYTTTTWQIIDAETTGATLSSSKLNTTAPGYVTVRATIKDGSAFDVDYTQDFVIEIMPLGIDENAELSGIRVMPNPTTGELRIENGELRIENVEISDLIGRKQKAESRKGEGEFVLNISHLAAGVYFVKISTEVGEVVKKVVKQ